MKKIFLLLSILLFFTYSVQSKTHFLQSKELNKLFNQLSKIENVDEADILEKEIWAVWNKHPKNKKLTEKLEFGTKLMYQGQYDYALKVFTNIIDNDPKWSEAWNKRATLLFFMQEYQKSLNDITQVLNLEPRHFGALSGRAQIYITLEQYQKALEDLRKAKEIHPVIRGNVLIKKIEELVNGQKI